MKWGMIFCASAVLVLGSCRQAKELSTNSMSISVSLVSLQSLLSQPTAPSLFDCFAVNVMGENISSTDPQRFPQSPLAQSGSCFYPGVTSQLFKGQGELNITVNNVPLGKNRIIQFLGFRGDVCKSDSTKLLNDLLLETKRPDISFREVFELGRAHTNLPGTTEIQVPQVFDPSQENLYLANCQNPFSGSWSSGCISKKSGSIKSMRVDFFFRKQKLGYGFSYFSEDNCSPRSKYFESRFENSPVSSIQEFQETGSRIDYSIVSGQVGVFNSEGTSLLNSWGCQLPSLGSYNLDAFIDHCQSSPLPKRFSPERVTINSIEKNIMAIRFHSISDQIGSHPILDSEFILKRVQKH